MVYWLELGFGVGSRMAGSGVDGGRGGGIAPASWNCVLWVSSNNGFFFLVLFFYNHIMSVKEIVVIMF